MEHLPAIVILENLEVLQDARHDICEGFKKRLLITLILCLDSVVTPGSDRQLGSQYIDI